MRFFFYINIMVHQSFFLFMDVILLYCLRFSMYVCLASVHALSFSPLDAMRFHDAYHSTMQWNEVQEILLTNSSYRVCVLQTHRKWSMVRDVIYSWMINRFVAMLFLVYTSISNKFITLSFWNNLRISLILAYKFATYLLLREKEKRTDNITVHN